MIEIGRYAYNDVNLNNIDIIDYQFVNKSKLC